MRLMPWIPVTIALFAALVLGGCGGDAGVMEPDRQEPQVASISVTPSQVALQQDSTIQFEAQARDQQGNLISGLELSWRVSDPAIAEVDDTGRVTGLEPGETSVIASAEGEEESAALKVRSGTTMVVDSTEMTLVSDSSERAEGTLRFQVRGGSPPEIEEGDYLVGAQRGGFLRQVEEVSESGSEIVVRTQQASLVEAVDSASFDGSIHVGPAEQTGAVREKQVYWGPTYNRYVANGVSVGDGAVTIENLVLLREEVCDGGGCVDAELVLKSGQVEFTPEVEVSADVGFFELDRFRAVGEGNLEFDARVEASATGTFQKSDEQRLAQFAKPFVFQAGPVPVAGEVRIDLFAGYQAEANATYSVSSGFESSYQTTLGAEWVEGEWSQLFSVDESFEPRPQTLSLAGEALARIYVKPELNIIFYTVAGPSAFTEPYLQGEGTFGETCTFDLTAGMDGGLGFQVEILSQELASFERSLNIGTTTLVSEDLGCDGDLEVSASTSGDNPDSDGYTVTLDGSQSVSIGPNGSTLYSDISTGDHEVELSGIKQNCSVQGDNPRTVNVAAGETEETAFSVTCGAPDLVAGSVDWSPTDPGPDTGMTFEGVIENDGALGAFNSFGWTILVDGASISSGTISELGVGESVAVTTEGSPTFPAGEHRIALQVDTDDTVEESDEGNNEVEATFTVESASQQHDIDFEGLSPGTYGPSLELDGVTFRSRSEGLAVLGEEPDRRSRVLCSFEGTECTGAIVFDFEGPANDLTFQLEGDDEAGRIAVVEIYRGGALIGTREPTGDGDLSTLHDVDLSDVSDVDRLVITPDDPVGLGYDNVRFQVPEAGQAAKADRSPRPVSSKTPWDSEERPSDQP